MKKLTAILSTSALAAGLVFASATSSQATVAQMEQQVINKLNVARTTKCANATSLKLSDGLHNSAQYHASDMASQGYLAYDSQNPYENWGHRIGRISGFNNLLGEVVDKNPGTVQDFVDRMLTPNTLTRRTALDCHMKVLGFGYAFFGPTGSFWDVDFSDRVVIFGI